MLLWRFTLHFHSDGLPYILFWRFTINFYYDGLPYIAILTVYNTLLFWRFTIHWYYDGLPYISIMTVYHTFNSDGLPYISILTVHRIFSFWRFTLHIHFSNRLSASKFCYFNFNLNIILLYRNALRACVNVIFGLQGWIAHESLKHYIWQDIRFHSPDIRLEKLFKIKNSFEK